MIRYRREFRRAGEAPQLVLVTHDRTMTDRDKEGSIFDCDIFAGSCISPIGRHHVAGAERLHAA
jgi:hypothetical protein